MKDEELALVTLKRLKKWNLWAPEEVARELAPLRKLKHPEMVIHQSGKRKSDMMIMQMGEVRICPSLSVWIENGGLVPQFYAPFVSLSSSL